MPLPDNFAAPSLIFIWKHRLQINSGPASGASRLFYAGCTQIYLEAAIAARKTIWKRLLQPPNLSGSGFWSLQFYLEAVFRAGKFIWKTRFGCQFRVYYMIWAPKMCLPDKNGTPKCVFQIKMTPQNVSSR